MTEIDSPLLEETLYAKSPQRLQQPPRQIENWASEAYQSGTKKLIEASGRYDREKDIGVTVQPINNDT